MEAAQVVTLSLLVLAVSVGLETIAKQLKRIADIMEEYWDREKNDRV